MVSPPRQSKRYDTKKPLILPILLILSAASAIASERVAQLTVQHFKSQADQLHEFVNPRYHYKLTYRGTVNMDEFGVEVFGTEYDRVTFESTRGSIGVGVSRNTDLGAENAHLPSGSVLQPFAIATLNGFLTTYDEKYFISKAFCFSRQHPSDVPKAAPHQFWSDDFDVFCIGAPITTSENLEEFYRLLRSFEFLPPVAQS